MSYQFTCSCYLIILLVHVVLPCYFMLVVHVAWACHQFMSYDHVTWSCYLIVFSKSVDILVQALRKSVKGKAVSRYFEMPIKGQAASRCASVWITPHVFHVFIETRLFNVFVCDFCFSMKMVWRWRFYCISYLCDWILNSLVLGLFTAKTRKTNSMDLFVFVFYACKILFCDFQAKFPNSVFSTEGF